MWDSRFSVCTLLYYTYTDFYSRTIFIANKENFKKKKLNLNIVCSVISYKLCRYRLMWKRKRRNLFIQMKKKEIKWRGSRSKLMMERIYSCGNLLQFIRNGLLVYWRRNMAISDFTHQPIIFPNKWRRQKKKITNPRRLFKLV